MKYIVMLMLSVAFFASKSLYSQEVKLQTGLKKYELVPAPYLNYSKVLGFGYGIAPMILYRVSKKDTISPKSLTGLLAAYTTNKSHLFIAYSKFYFNEDDWRLSVIAGKGDVNFQFYLESDLPVGGFYDYNSDFSFVGMRLQRRVFNKLYLGVSYGYVETFTTFDNFPTGINFSNHILQMSIISDQRDDVYYPRKGYIAKLLWTTRPVWLSNDANSNTIELVYNGYKSMRQNKDVLAGRIRVEVGFGDISFNEQVIIGRVDLRGYNDGKYRGDAIYSAQGEYRWNFYKSIGIVGFAGIATLTGSINDDFNGKLYPSIGTGVRYNFFKENKINVGLDVALAKDDWGLYFRIGEAF